jgi:hypothetical protein
MKTFVRTLVLVFVLATITAKARERSLIQAKHPMKASRTSSRHS